MCCTSEFLAIFQAAQPFEGECKPRNGLSSGKTCNAANNSCVSNRVAIIRPGGDLLVVSNRCGQQEI